MAGGCTKLVRKLIETKTTMADLEMVRQLATNQRLWTSIPILAVVIGQLQCFIQAFCTTQELYHDAQGVVGRLNSHTSGGKSVSKPNLDKQLATSTYQ